MLYTCCGPMRLICTRMVITDDSLRKLNYLKTEANPGPSISNVDPTLAVRALYSQGDITVFGGNVGQQCVAMSLCALIYNNLSKEQIDLMTWYKLWKG